MILSFANKKAPRPVFRRRRGDPNAFAKDIEEGSVSAGAGVILSLVGRSSCNVCFRRRRGDPVSMARWSRYGTCFPQAGDPIYSSRLPPGATCFPQAQGDPRDF